MTQEDNFFTGHAVEFDINSFSVIFFGVEDHWLNSNRKIQVDDLEGSVEDVAGEVADEVLPDHEINHFLLLVLLVHDSLVFL